MSTSIPAPMVSIAAFLAVLSVAGCGEDSPSSPADCREIEVGEVTLDPPGPLTLTRVMGGVVTEASFEDGCGQPLVVAPERVAWTSSDPSVVTARALEGSERPTGFIQARGFGEADVSATFGSASGSLRVSVVDPGTEAVGFSVVGSGVVAHATTDLWVHGDHAYSGSQAWSCASCAEAWLYVWRLPPDGGLEKVDSLSLPARIINDVKVAADGAWGVATMESGEVGENGIALLDLTDPGAPSVVTRFTDGLERGVHNVWLERLDGRDYVFAVEEGGPADDAGVHVLDVTERAAPVEVALFHAGASFPHDVYVRDGLAFVSHWGAGLVILDVGNGVRGGSPAQPVEIGRVVTAGDHVHNAWYWPERQLVFVGEERFPPPERIDEVGVMHVVDVSDMSAPVEVARYGVPGSTPHNFWLDEDDDVLYAAWYVNGLRAIDVSGPLSGDLSTQGLELGRVIPSGHRGAGSIWAPQLHAGRIYLSDVYNGVWSVRFDG